MGKLITPLHYEPAVDGLNAVRPLVLADEIKQELSLPILNQNPVDSINSARGKFLQSDNQGAGVSRDSAGYKNVIEKVAYLHAGIPTKVVDFGRIVEYISGYTITPGDTVSISFMDSTFTTAWLTYLAADWGHTIFRGRILYIKGNGGGGMDVNAMLYAFY